jgi:hypothetical protein
LKASSLRIIFLLALMVASCLSPAHAHAEEFVYFAALTGTAEAPPNNSPGAGTAVVVLDTTLSQLHIEVQFSGLDGAVASAHIQGLTAQPGAGVADSATGLPTLSGFVSGVTSGFYHGVLDLNFEPNYNPDFIAAHGGTLESAYAALSSGLSEGRTYFNIRTSSFPEGEIRGFLAPSPTADFDHNGRVNGADLNLWSLTFAAGDFGDADKDGDADGADFVQWQRQLGQIAEIPHHHHGAGAAAAIVPEPRAACLFVFALLLTLKKKPGQACSSARLLKHAA